ncbi:hypothetical protein B0H14DRAFT_2554163 [Mycena olivaceomarginata]|nr:hypothetical protein B0H14DRAFT_2554163 [Mycena olivaceomarginata]
MSDTGFFLHGNRSSSNLLTCKIELLVVTYHYFNGSYRLLAREPSDLTQEQHIMEGSWVGLYYVPIPVDGTGLYSGSYANMFSAWLSLVTLVTTVYVIKPVEVLQIENTWNLIGSRLPLTPLLFTLTFIYWCMPPPLLRLCIGGGYDHSHGHHGDPNAPPPSPLPAFSATQPTRQMRRKAPAPTTNSQLNPSSSFTFVA